MAKRKSPAKRSRKPAPIKEAPAVRIDTNVDIEDYPLERPTLYPWKDMEIGHSFHIEIKDENLRTKRKASIPASGNSWAKRQGLDWQFTSRLTDTGIRVWRVA